MYISGSSSSPPASLGPPPSSVRPSRPAAAASSPSAGGSSSSSSMSDMRSSLESCPLSKGYSATSLSAFSRSSRRFAFSRCSTSSHMFTQPMKPRVSMKRGVSAAARSITRRCSAHRSDTALQRNHPLQTSRRERRAIAALITSRLRFRLRAASRHVR